MGPSSRSAGRRASPAISPCLAKSASRAAFSFSTAFRWASRRRCDDDDDDIRGWAGGVVWVGNERMNDAVYRTRRVH